MIFKPLPSPSDAHLKRYLWSSETIVVEGAASNVAYNRHVAPLSLKLTLAGEERYNVHGFEASVRPSQMLIINAHQPYASRICTLELTKTRCLFFSDADIVGAHQSGLADGRLLDDPERDDHTARAFPGVVQTIPPALRAQLAALPLLRQATRLAQDEYALKVASALFALDSPAWRSPPEPRRTATRRELLRRCLIARSYIEACFAEEISLADIARVSGLSRSHLHRAYKQCLGEAPTATLRKARMTEAARLLRAGRAVSEAALASGYADFAAFSRAFKAYFGAAPSAYRRAK